MTQLVLVSNRAATPTCTRCRQAPGGRVFDHPLLGRQSYCARCARNAGGSDAAIVAEMDDLLFREAARGGLDLDDWHAVRDWLLACHWTLATILALGDAAVERARLRLQRRAAVLGAIANAIEAVALFGFVAVWVVVYCLVCPPAHAAAALPTGAGPWWVDLLPAAVFLAIAGSLIAVTLRRSKPLIDEHDDVVGDTTNWSRRR